MPTSTELSPERAIDRIAERFGRHVGYRALHAKGTLCRGRFTATADAARLTRAAHMQGEPVDVTVRLSNGAGDPDSPDYSPDVRGVAAGFHLPGGERTDIVAQTAPRFPVRDAEAFMQLVEAGKPGPAQPLRLLAFLARHPGAAGALRANFPALKPPASYAACTFYAVHAFKWLDADGGERWVRYMLLPQEKASSLSSKEAKERGRDYLQRDLADRLGRDPIRFDLQLQIAADGDDVDDPMAVWPSERETVAAGTLEITEVEDAGDRDKLIFDPTKVSDGIELSDDPILHYRPRAYSVSYERRTAGSA